MDQKISDFATVSTIFASDILPIVSVGENKSISVGLLSLNLPNIGNKGITKNTVVSPQGASIPLTGTLVKLVGNQTPYTLPSGSDGQEIVLVALGTLTVESNASYFQSVNMHESSSLSLIFVLAAGKWIIKSSHNCTFQ